MSSAKDFHDTPFTGSDDESSTTLLEHHREAILGLRSDKPKRYIQLLVGLVVILCTVSVVYTAAAVHGMASQSQRDFGDCGSDNTVEQARAKGCVFDPMGWVWVRPECYDDKMIHEFMNRTEFTWHTEPKLRPDTQVPLEVVFRGDHPKLFTQRKYHDIHLHVEENAQGTVGENAN
ncbi:hypothetical protein BBO_00726 [Beauveria brongniartii RCEF 3172]|uniref:Uncharacterized protein n=1 Tax=Beauveria brongniartii RCEF 3172 TaxID=1081107 RepID=A0A167JUK3_9HYPO|nr:hypothetical protein BBO_00726 [Beauveria brongniartii RCEF 3172]